MNELGEQLESSQIMNKILVDVCRQQNRRLRLFIRVNVLLFVIICCLILLIILIAK